MKKLLIISPYFPPVNAADMQRIRMSLPYFKQEGWAAEVVTVDEHFADFPKDTLLLQSVPEYIKVHKVNAFSKKWTVKIGLGSLALRSLWFYKEYVNQLLRKQSFDLIYFSTTQFPVCILGAYWKRKFKIPYVIDMQDPWHSDYYQDKPKTERPAKYWFSYRLNKYLEPVAMKHVGGLIAVSQSYLSDLKARYPRLIHIPTAVITFGAFNKDFEIAKEYIKSLNNKQLSSHFFNFVYVGRGGFDMRSAAEILFKAFKIGLENYAGLFSKVRFTFIGTSYAGGNKGVKTIYPVAETLNIGQYVTEETGRISFYQGLNILQAANGLVILGSDDEAYTASKIYPYIQASKPLLGFFNPKSSASQIIQQCTAGTVISLNIPQEEAIENTFQYMLSLLKNPDLKPHTDWEKFKQYDAKRMTQKQCALFEKVDYSSH